MYSSKMGLSFKVTRHEHEKQSHASDPLDEEKGSGLTDEVW